MANLQKKIRQSKIASWFTQPLAVLGFDQSPEMGADWARQLCGRGYVVSDEVTDQSCPSRLSSAKEWPSANLIRIRSFTKGMGLNGLRLAAILHGERLRNPLVNALE